MTNHWQSDTRDGVEYPYECRHSAPPCMACLESWSQFDPLRGSLRAPRLPTPPKSTYGDGFHDGYQKGWEAAVEAIQALIDTHDYQNRHDPLSEALDRIRAMEMPKEED